MGLGDSPILKIISGQFNIVTKFFDTAYKAGWLLYLIVGLIGLLLYIVFFN